MTVFFVAGIHAVGKSTVCKTVAQELGFFHYTASQIIRSEKSSMYAGASKSVADVAENQRLLIQGVSKLSTKGDMLLDGHFTLQRSSDGGVEEIDVDVFRKLRVCGIVVFIDNPIQISGRLLARDGYSPSVEFLQMHQEAEIKHAQYVASSLGLPIRILHAFDMAGIANILSEWKKSKMKR